MGRLWHPYMKAFPQWEASLQGTAVGLPYCNVQISEAHCKCKFLIRELKDRSVGDHWLLVFYWLLCWVFYSLLISISWNKQFWPLPIYYVQLFSSFANLFRSLLHKRRQVWYFNSQFFAQISTRSSEKGQRWRWDVQTVFSHQLNSLWLSPAAARLGGSNPDPAFTIKQEKGATLFWDISLRTGRQLFRA